MLEWPSTDLIKKLGIQLPIIQAPMAGGATTPELIAAVSNAGGLGSLGAGYMTADDIRKVLKKIRELTDKPFAVNLFIPEEHYASTAQMQKACARVQQSCLELNTEIKPVTSPYNPPFAEQISVLIEEKIPIFSFTFGIPDKIWISKLKNNGTLLLGTATHLAEARALQEANIDVIVAQGSEAGGHRGTFIGKPETSLIGIMSLLPQIIDQVKIPVIASGGIMDARGIIAAMLLGAVGVQMGTAFLSCPESGIHLKYKKILLSMTEDNTTLTRAFSGKLARGIRNRFIERLSMHEEDILDYPIQNALTRVMRQQADKQDCIDFMSMWAGQSACLSKGIPAADLISELVREIKIILNSNKFFK